MTSFYFLNKYHTQTTHTILKQLIFISSPGTNVLGEVLSYPRRRCRHRRRRRCRRCRRWRRQFQVKVFVF